MYINKVVNPKGLKKDEYDVIIIGAGIGGLVCGCYLAKAGLKVLIVEKNDKPGGYCTSFERGEFRFDACVYSLGSCRKGGILSRILYDDLELKNEIPIKKVLPRRLIISDDKRIAIKDTFKDTVDELCRVFPKERVNIRRLFKDIIYTEYLSLFGKTHNLNFSKFLTLYNIKNKELRNLFSFLFLESSGLPNSKISAFMGVILLKDYILDGGYYPVGGMQNLSYKLASRFKSLGGRIIFNTKVEKIFVLNKKVKGVQTENKQNMNSSIVVSNIDLRTTLLKLLDRKIDKDCLTKILNLKPSLSSLILYLKLKTKKIPFPSYVRFVSLSKDIDKIYDSILIGNFSNIYLDCFINKYLNPLPTVNISIVAPFKTKNFWDKKRSEIIDKLLSMFINRFNLSYTDIELVDIATPFSLHRWVGSYKGANFGWDAIPEQVFPKFNLDLEIYGLYFVGHWVGKGHGVSTVAYLGKQTAKKLVTKLKARI